MLSWVIGAFNTYRIYIIVGVILLVIYRAYGFGYDRAEALCEKSKSVATENKLKIKERQDEIRNAPNSVAITTDRLRNATF